MSVAAILLAGGASARMGTPKPLLLWGKRTLLSWEIDQLAASETVDEIVVVLGRYADAVRRSLGEHARHCVFNQRWPQGRSTSLARGARALCGGGRTSPEAVLIQNVDQPTTPEIIDELVRNLQSLEGDGVQPSYRGHGAHPVVIGGHLLPALLRVDEQTMGLRAILSRFPPRRLVMDDQPLVAIDLDRPEDVAAARALFEQLEAL